MRGLILTDDDFEEAELLVPYYRLLGSSKGAGRQTFPLSCES